MQWVVDTNVFVVANDHTDSRYFDCLTFITTNLTRDQLVLDSEGSIADEYRRNIPPFSYVGAWLYRFMGQSGSCLWYSSKPDKRTKDALHKLGFDRSDYKWVAVAACTADSPHIIVNIADSDWTETVQDWLQRNQNTIVISPGNNNLKEIAAGKEED